MDKKHRYFEELCEPVFLLQAWKHVRACKGAAGADEVTLAEYERELLGNLADLAVRLREERYYPLPMLRFNLQKENGKARALGLFTVEDRIVMRAMSDLLTRLWEPAFLNCSYGFRPGRNTELAVKQVLEYRRAGDEFVVDADVADCFGSLDHAVVLNLVGRRVRDNRALRLIRMWLTLTPQSAAEALGEAGAADWFDRVSEVAVGLANDAVSQMLHGGGYGGSYGSGYAGYGAGYGGYAPLEPVAVAPSSEELQRAARKEAFKRLGKDAALLGLTYLGRSRLRSSWMLSPVGLAVTGATVLAGAAYPAANRWWRARQGNSAEKGAVQGSPLSPLLANIVLHEFDLALTGAGYRLVRFADDFVVTCRDAASAERALDFAARKLAQLHLRLHPEKTRVVAFTQGLVFLGYKFDQFQLTATPAPAATQLPIRLRWREAPAALKELQEKARPAVTQAWGQAKAGAARVAEVFRRRRE